MLAYRSLLHTKYAISICGNRDQSPFTKIQMDFYSYTWVSEGKKESISPPNFRAPAQKWAIMLSPKTVHKFLYKIPDTHSVWETDTYARTCAFDSTLPLLEAVRAGEHVLTQNLLVLPTATATVAASTPTNDSAVPRLETRSAVDLRQCQERRALFPVAAGDLARPR